MEFQELTPEILHRFIETIEIKADEVREFFIGSRTICFLFN
ncbi:DUF4368 domain-containing protein [Bacillus subtilis]